MNQIQKEALKNSILTTLYIVAVATFMNFGEKVKIGKNAFLAPIAFLMLFVFSAALTGFLIFGKPGLMYLDGKKKEALSLITYTLVFFFTITFSAILLLLLFTR